MIESVRCSLCNLELKSIDKMLGRWRLEHHQEIEHNAECNSCERKFTSYSNVAVHAYLTHEVRCVNCGDMCEGVCLVKVIKDLERNQDENGKKDMMFKIETRISEEEAKYNECFVGISERYMWKLKEAIHALDEGLTGCLANSFGMLGYLPFIEANSKHKNLSRFGRKLIERQQFLSAMVKLNLYLIDIQEISQGNLSVIIPRYVKDCEQMNDENEIMELKPEELVGKHLCLPERTIGGPETSEWTNFMYIKTFGIHDNLKTNNEHYSVQSSHSNRQEEMVGEIPAVSGNKKMIIDSNRYNDQSSSNEKFDIEISNGTGNPETNSSRNDDKVFANKKPEKLNIEINGVTENTEDNLESLLGKKESLNNDYIEICELPAENRVTGSNNIETYDECDYAEEVEIVKVSSNVINKDDEFNSEFLLREDDLIKWQDITKSNLVTVTEDEQGIEMVQERKNKTYNGKEIDDSEDTTIKVLDFFTTSEEEELDEWLIKTDNHLNLEKTDSILAVESISKKDNPSDWIIRKEAKLVNNESDRIAKKAGDTEDNVFDFFTNSEEEKPDGGFEKVENLLNLEEPDGIHKVETVSERNNLIKRITKAENELVHNKVDRIAKKVGDTEYVKLTVKKDKFVAVNDIKIEEHEGVSCDLRVLLNYLVNWGQMIDLAEEDSEIKGIISAESKTIIEIIEDEESKNENNIKASETYTITDCQKGHPYISASNFGLLKIIDDPKPRIEKEGAKLIIHGKAWIGEDPHYFLGELKEASEPIVIKNRNNIIMAKCMEIHEIKLYNDDIKECSLKMEQPISAVIDKNLLEELNFIMIGQDSRKTNETNDISSTDKNEEPIIDGLEIVFGLEIQTELEKAKEMLIENNKKIEMKFYAEVLQPGEDFLTINKDETQITHRTLLAEIKVIVEKNTEEEIVITRSMLNNVRRKFKVDLCTIPSFIMNTEYPERSRKFRIVWSSKKCIESDTKIIGTYYSEDINYEEVIENHNDQIVQKIENVVEEPFPGIIVKISLKEILKGLKMCENLLDNDNDLTAVSFLIKIESPGTGSLTEKYTSNETNMKVVMGKLALILSVTENDDIEISRCFLNGVRRTIMIEPEERKSILFKPEKPWRSRRFSIKERFGYEYFEKDDDTDEENDNEGKIDERFEKKKRERYLIYKKDTETCRTVIPFKDTVKEDEKISDDPRNGGKMGEKLNQENIFEEVPIHNKVYRGLERLSKAAILGFSSLKETVSKISENQDKNAKVEEMMNKYDETKNDSSQYQKKNGLNLKNRMKFEPFSLSGLILMAILFGSVEAGIVNNKNNNEIKKDDSAWKNSKDSMKSYEDLVIKAYDCLQDNQPGTTLSLRAPKECQLQDGSAYYPSKFTNAQVLEKLTLVPVNITLCTVHFYVSVGWCGGEFALENYKHGDVQTLRSQILVSEGDCNRAETDGFLKISTPEYGSIGELDIKLNLEGGRSQALFQPVGVSRPNSWCKGEVFYPPQNDDRSISYLDYKAHFEKKQLWQTERIRRAVVTYELEADVKKIEAFISLSENKLIIPNQLEIERTRNFRKERFVDMAAYRNNKIENEDIFLESYQDLAYGTITFNISGLPRSECEAIRSVSKVRQGKIMKSKLESLSIIKYNHEGEETAVTLEKKIDLCGREAYETRVKNIFVVLLGREEGFLENEKVRINEVNQETIHAAEVRSALNSVELSQDSIYQDINFRMCKMQRQQILIMQTMLSNQMEILKDGNDDTVFTHTAGEISKVRQCKKVGVKVRKGDDKCCEELPVFTGENYEVKAYMRPINRQITKVCTPRVCSEHTSPVFQIGTDDEEVWIKVEKTEIIATKNPKELKANSHNKEETMLLHESDIFNEELKEKFSLFSFVHNARKLLEGTVIQKMYPAEVLTKLNKFEETEVIEKEENLISYRIQNAILPWPLNCLHILPDWLIITIIGVIGLILLKVVMDPLLACMTLISDSSLSIIQRVASIIVPATTVSWINRKKNPQIELKEMEDVEARIADLEVEIKLVRSAMIKNGNVSNTKRAMIEE